VTLRCSLQALLALAAALSITTAATRAGQAGETADWLGYNGDYAATRYSPLDQVNVTNVAKLKRVCSFALGNNQTFSAGPTIVDGTMYVTTIEDTYALDAATCRPRWKDRLRAPSLKFAGNRGVGYDGGVVFRGIYSGSVLALDAATGKHLWQTKIVRPGSSEYIDAAPIVEDGLVIIGTAGADFGARCQVVALDEFTGKVSWRFALGSRDVSDVGGSNWTSITFDRAKGLLYVPTGNPGPELAATSVRNFNGGSVFVLDAGTGKPKRWNRPKTYDGPTWDVSAPPSLIALPDGKKILAESGKDGYLYRIDVGSGKLRYRTAVKTVADDGMSPEAGGARACPGAASFASGWNGTAYSPATNFVYVNTNDDCAAASRDGRDAALDIANPIPESTVADVARNSGGVGWLHAVDLNTGKIAWAYRANAPLLAAVTTTAGGVVFTGDLHGDFYAFDARDGQVIYRTQMGKPIAGGIASYAVSGKQYIAVTGGRPSSVWKLPPTSGTVAVYSL
jgi:alcohol dehydrogenase (cytochrome c)